MTCRHCDAPLAGLYCHACGQKALADDALTARAIGAEAWQHATALDFKTLRSLRTLFVPGKLTADFIDGHRLPYLSPVKVYLLCGALFFMATSLTGFTLDAIVTADRTGFIGKSVAESLQASGLTRAHFIERFELRFQSVYTVSLVISVAAVALLNALLFRRQRRPAAAHAVFALHYVAFLYLAGIAVGFIAVRVSMPSAYTLPLLYLFLGPYLFFALRRVYGDTPGRAIVKTITILVVTLIIDSLVNFMAFMLTLRLV
jgi:hypothetical protein